MCTYLKQVFLNLFVLSALLCVICFRRLAQNNNIALKSFIFMLVMWIDVMVTMNTYFVANIDAKVISKGYHDGIIEK